jgi:hypothetical protein
MKEFHVTIARYGLLSSLSDCEQKISQRSSTVHPSDMIIVLQPPTPPTIETLEEWQAKRVPSDCAAMDARTDALVNSFRTARATANRLLEATFVWRKMEIRLLLEVAVPQSPDEEDVRVLRHVWRAI